MRAYTYVILLLVSVLVSCGSNKAGTSEEVASLRSEADELDIQAYEAARSRDNWKALGLFEKADKLYAEAGSKDDLKFRYMIYRQRANVLNRLKLYDMAKSSMDMAIEFLDKAPNLPKGYDRNRELISSKRYRATYTRNNRDFLESNEYLLPLVEYPESIKGLNAQVKNLIGQNFYDLHDYEKAYSNFDDILKISDLQPKLKAHYLINRSKAAFKLGDKQQAFNDMSQALGINSTLGRDMYTFVNRMELGELYMFQNDFAKANENFDIALSTFKNIDTDPDLFKIYSMKYTSEVGLGVKTASDYKLKYDSLNELYVAQKTQYTSQEELEMYAAGIGKWNYDQLHFEYWYQNPVYWIVLFALITVVLSLFWSELTSLLFVNKKNRSGNFTGF